MTDTDDTTREQPRTPVWRLLLLHVGIGAAGTVGSATVTWIFCWLQC
ncbi:hypothetical protein [Streptomyces sp. NBC_01243]|nr:hypothetical protein OG348_42925 [Streptomyces sp. NBC_01243]